MGTVRVSGNTTVGGTLDVAGNTSIGGTFLATGAATFDDDASVSGNLHVGGTATIGGAAQITGNVSLGGQLFLAKSGAAAISATAINGITSVSLNFSNAQNFLTTVTAAHTLARPTNATKGQTGSIFLVQSGGSGTLAYNTCWKFIGASVPTLDVSNGAVGRLDYIVVSVSSDNTGENIHAILTNAYGNS